MPRGPLCHPRLRLNKATAPLLAEHVIRGEPVVPASAFLEMALEFGATTLYACQFSAMLSLSHKRPLTVQVKRDAAQWSVATQQQPRHPTMDADGNVSELAARLAHEGGLPFDVLHSQGFLSEEATADVSKLDLAALRSKMETCDAKTLYTRGWDHFAAYGPSFKRVQSIMASEDDVVAVIRGIS